MAIKSPLCNYSGSIEELHSGDTPAGAEPGLGNPSVDGYVLSSTTAGIRSWVATLKDADIGVTVQAYDADTAKLDVAQSWVAQQTFGELKEGVYTITDGAAFEIDPANGTYQTITLGDNRTPAATNFESGQAVVLMVDDGTAYTLTWTTIGVTWKTDSGSAPTLDTTGYTVILLWKVGATIYGARIGNA